VVEFRLSGFRLCGTGASFIHRSRQGEEKFGLVTDQLLHVTCKLAYALLLGFGEVLVKEIRLRVCAAWAAGGRCFHDMSFSMRSGVGVNRALREMIHESRMRRIGHSHLFFSRLRT